MSDDTATVQGWLDTQSVVDLPANTTLNVTNLTSSTPGQVIRGPKSAVLKKIDQTAGNGHADPNALIRVEAPDVRLEGFTLDGGHTDETQANGFTAHHVGVFVSRVTFAERLSCVRLHDLTARNFGDRAFLGQFVDDIEIKGNRVSRCGSAGITLWNARRARIADNRIENIYPGQSATDHWRRNAYGINVSNWTAEGMSEDVWIENNHVSGVTSWTGIDCHNVKRAWIKGNSIRECSNPIAIEHHVNGQEAEDYFVCDNLCESHGSGFVRDGLTFPSQGGISINAANGGEQGSSIVVTGNVLKNCGNTQAAAGPSSDNGAIKARQCEGLLIANNVLSDNWRIAISLTYTGSTQPQGITSSLVNSNIINRTHAWNAMQRDVRLWPPTVAHVVGNYAIGSGDGFVQHGSTLSTFADNRKDV